MIGRIIGTLVVMVLLLGLAIIPIGMASQVAHTFYGKAEFSSLDEVQQFQSEVVAKVKGMGGSVDSFDLSVMSPPTVNYRLYIPSSEDPGYGSRGLSPIAALAFQIFVGLVFLAGAIFCNVEVWRASGT